MQRAIPAEVVLVVGQPVVRGKVLGRGLSMACQISVAPTVTLVALRSRTRHVKPVGVGLPVTTASRSTAEPAATVTDTCTHG